MYLQWTLIISFFFNMLLDYTAVATWLNRGPSGFITNGKAASNDYFPFQAAIYFKRTTSPTLSFCGGSVISRTLILTAAHCTIGKDSADVRLGTSNIASKTSGYKVSVPKENIITHEAFNETSLLNDIGLLRLQIPIDFYLNPTVKPINLPTVSGLNYVGVQANASGFGLLSDNSTKTSDNLQYATLTIVENTVCSNRYKYFNGQTTLCVATQNGTSTCSGDSGGSLSLYNASQNSWQAIGIVSYGSYAGCEVGRPVVFTRVDSYLDWINSKM